MELAIVLVTCPIGLIAQEISDILVTEGLAACVNVLDRINSTYKWQGKLEHTQESLLIIKAKTANLKKLEKRLYEIHPYDIPEFVVIGPKIVGQKYLSWVLES
jgi:periplasmic divalent cation tolerance protein